MTIPTLVQNTETQISIVGVKKAYNTLSQAYTMASLENGDPDSWGLSDNKNMLAVLAPYLKITKNCIDGSKGCFSSDYKKLNNTAYLTSDGKTLDDAVIPKVILADGTLLLGSAYPSCGSYNTWGTSENLQNLCGEYYVDVNGPKKPNQWGKDLFAFNLTRSGIIPTGTSDYVADNDYNFNKCNTSGRGFGCTAWVIYNENRDYLKCNDLTWGGKTKCSP